MVLNNYYNKITSFFYNLIYSEKQVITSRVVKIIDPSTIIDCQDFTPNSENSQSLEFVSSELNDKAYPGPQYTKTTVETAEDYPPFPAYPEAEPQEYYSSSVEYSSPETAEDYAPFPAYQEAEPQEYYSSSVEYPTPSEYYSSSVEYSSPETAEDYAPFPAYQEAEPHEYYSSSVAAPETAESSLTTEYPKPEVDDFWENSESPDTNDNYWGNWWEDKNPEEIQLVGDTNNHEVA